jgi:hypothetical protein
MGSYRWSRLHGNFEGFFRNDNGQSDPAITSLYDFPTNDPSYTAIGVPEFGFRGDIRFLGELGAGPLPNDRPHQFKLFGNRAFGDLSVGAGLIFGSGRPLTALAANPAYQSDGEIPETARGGGFDTVDGFKERTPFETDFDLHVDYSMRMGDRRVVLLADAFNVFNIRRVRSYNQNSELSPTVPDPDFGAIQDSSDTTWSNAAYQPPFRLRVGIRYEF